MSNFSIEQERLIYQTERSKQIHTASENAQKFGFHSFLDARSFNLWYKNTPHLHNEDLQIVMDVGCSDNGNQINFSSLQHSLKMLDNSTHPTLLLGIDPALKSALTSSTNSLDRSKGDPNFLSQFPQVTAAFISSHIENFRLQSLFENRVDAISVVTPIPSKKHQIIADSFKLLKPNGEMLIVLDIMNLTWLKENDSIPPIIVFTLFHACEDSGSVPEFTVNGILYDPDIHSKELPLETIFDFDYFSQGFPHSNFIPTNHLNGPQPVLFIKAIKLP